MVHRNTFIKCMITIEFRTFPQFLVIQVTTKTIIVTQKSQIKSNNINSGIKSPELKLPTIDSTDGAYDFNFHRQPAIKLVDARIV